MHCRFTTNIPVKVRERFFKKKSMGHIVVCPVCKEAYPAVDGGIYRGCQDEALDLSPNVHSESE